MSVRCVTLLLSLYLSCQKAWTDSTLNVTTGLFYNLIDPDSVTVICQYERQEDWMITVKLHSNKNKVCETSQRQMCEWSQEGNQTMFKLKNLTSAEKNLQYHCEVYRRSPVPVLKELGHTFRLFPESHIFPHIPCPNTDSGIVCPPPETPNTLIWAWALIGLMLLLCLYSVIITTFYIRLKITKYEDINDTLTYVPMQKQVRQQDADKNAEYMDMRKVHPRGGPIRDMNHNSHRLPAGYII